MKQQFKENYVEKINKEMKNDWDSSNQKCNLNFVTMYGDGR